MLSQLEQIGRKMGRLREAFGEDEDSDWRELEAVRRELKHALREKRGASAEERSRIVAILKQAIVQIRAKG
jgi:hypothetical protein